jgi:diguanylate cyclase (GGDEF)-like protein
MRRMIAVACLLAVLCADGAVAAVLPPAEQLLQQADRVKTSDHPLFVQLLERLDNGRQHLSERQRWQLRYLDAWEVVYRADYGNGERLLEDIIEHAPYRVLRLRAVATAINMLGIEHRYGDAFERLSQLQELLPTVSDKVARLQGLGEAAQLLIDAGQYDLALDFADRMLASLPPGESTCKSLFFKAHARYRSGLLQDRDPLMRTAMDACTGASESVFANALRADLAGYDLQHDRPHTAIRLLQAHYAQAQEDRYADVMWQFDALLAQAYWATGNQAMARKHALATVQESRSDYSQSLAMAYRVLSLLERKAGNYSAALAYHEKYMAADKAYLNDISAKALAYQMVRQQVQAKRAEVDALARRNQILRLQQALDRKAVEASRLYIAVLLLGLLAIGLWLLRLKRSQLQFMRLAQRDSLTGICNRKHFMSEAEHALGDARRSSRGACLVLIDLDHFKLTNDTYGHAMGDQVLRRAVAACQEHVRSTDVFGRLGGEEFGVLLSECAMDGGIERAEAFRRAIATLGGQEEPGVPVSASFGVACTGESSYELRQLLMDADHALYRAKRAGRNCVVAGKQGEGVVIA